MKKLAIGVALPLVAISLHAACVDQDVDLPVLIGEEGPTVPRPDPDGEEAGAGGMAGSSAMPDAGGGTAGSASPAGSGGMGGMGGMGGSLTPDSGAPASDAATPEAADADVDAG